jgi:acyl-CoA synthetase (AMP-forming)/AMP-acid ligase II
VQAQARAHPDVLAVVDVDGDRRVTYRALADLVRQGSAALIAAGVEPGDRVAIWAPDSLEWIAVQLAIASVGAVLVPLNTRFQGSEVAELLERSQVRLAFTVERFLDRSYREVLEAQPVSSLRHVVTLDQDFAAFLRTGQGRESDADRRSGLVSADDWLDLLFTSGTTGRPKGVRSTHGVTIRAFRYYAENLGIGLADRYLLINPLFHTFGSKAGVVASLAVGATLYPVPVFDAAAAAAIVAAERITVLPGPPTIFHALLQLAPETRSKLRSLRLAVTGAAAVPVELLQRMRHDLGFDVVLTAYGLTETCGLVTMCVAGDTDEVVSATTGRAIPGVEVAVVGPDGSPLPTGEPGEIVVRGYQVMDGYYQDPEATAATIDPDGWLHTGDVGILDEQGGLRITDRIKDMFIVGGFNAYPAEIEAVLMEASGVSQVAVVGVPDERLGEVGAAFVVARRGADIDPDQLLGFARERMANFKVPRSVRVVDALPVNAGGKVMKHVLRQQAIKERGPS